jgi:hypothetical protein
MPPTKRLFTDLSAHNPKSVSLYELAKKKAWNPSIDLQWPSTRKSYEFPLARIANPLSGYSEYENSSHEKKLDAAWLLHGLELSEILFGEQTALMLAAQLVEHAPSTEAQLFLSSQVFDEARHVEFFMRYLSEYIGRIHPPSCALKLIAQDALSTQSWRQKYLVCHGLIESLALAKFQQLHTHSRDPLLATAIELIMKDEARHVAFGIDALASELIDMTPDLRRSSALELIDQTMALGQATDSSEAIAQAYSWDPIALQQHLRLHQTQHPELGKLCFRYLILTMRRIGLWCNECQERIERLESLGN